MDNKPAPDSLPAYLDLGNGQPFIRCRDKHQALNLATLYVAMTTDTRAGIVPHPSHSIKKSSE